MKYYCEFKRNFPPSRDFEFDDDDSAVAYFLGRWPNMIMAVIKDNGGEITAIFEE